MGINYVKTNYFIQFFRKILIISDYIIFYYDFYTKNQSAALRAQSLDLEWSEFNLENLQMRSMNFLHFYSNNNNADDDEEQVDNKFVITRPWCGRRATEKELNYCKEKTYFILTLGCSCEYYVYIQNFIRSSHVHSLCKSSQKNTIFLFLKWTCSKLSEASKKPFLVFQL